MQIGYAAIMLILIIIATQTNTYWTEQPKGWINTTKNVSIDPLYIGNNQTTNKIAYNPTAFSIYIQSEEDLQIRYNTTDYQGLIARNIYTTEEIQGYNLIAGNTTLGNQTGTTICIGTDNYLCQCGKCR